LTWLTYKGAQVCKGKVAKHFNKCSFIRVVTWLTYKGAQVKFVKTRLLNILISVVS